MRKPTCALAGLLLVMLGGTAAPAAESTELISCRKIWDAAPHNAFTSLTRFRDQWYCAFREGSAHVSPDGAIRILRSADGADWKEAARITLKDADLRDPGLSVSPGDQLVLIAAAAWNQPPAKDGAAETHQTFVWTSPDGENWTDATPVGDPNFWIWKLTWFGPDVWGMGYATAREGIRHLRLYSGRTGTDLKKVSEIPPDDPEAWLTESSLAFDADGTMYCLQRRDPHTFQGLLGIARPPYNEWTWKPLGIAIGGPALIQLRDGRLAAVVRRYDPVRTVVGTIDPVTGTFTEWQTLPSGGDCSYAGMAEWNGMLWISYYSSHEGKTSIYLARVTLPPPADIPVPGP